MRRVVAARFRINGGGRSNMRGLGICPVDCLIVIFLELPRKYKSDRFPDASNALHLVDSSEFFEGVELLIEEINTKTNLICDIYRHAGGEVV